MGQATRIRMSHEYGETVPNVFDDIDWVRQNRKMLLEQYGECSILVYQRSVIGVGANYEEALLNARQNLGTNAGDITPVYERLHNRKLFSRVRLK